MAGELWWRLGCFLSALSIMLLYEWLKPARQPVLTNRRRWPVNFGLMLVSSVLVRLTVPVGLTAIALYNQQHGIGVFNNLPFSMGIDAGMLSIIVVVSVVLLDIIIYWQHRLFHEVPMLWRLHRVHHSDSHVDASTGLRFHPIEIILSLLIKIVAISVLGVPAIAVLIFEITLNALALFNHANIRLPANIEKPLRRVLMTQVLHRIHHSRRVSETNTNYGFSVIWWDKLFGSYLAKASQPDSAIRLGLTEYPATQRNTSLRGVLTMPFKSPTAGD